MTSPKGEEFSCRLGKYKTLFLGFSKALDGALLNSEGSAPRAECTRHEARTFGGFSFEAKPKFLAKFLTTLSHKLNI